MLLVLSVAALMVTMMVAVAMPAFAAPGGVRGSNSAESSRDIGGEEGEEVNEGTVNFGHYQSQVAKAPGSASSAKITNPALVTGQDPEGTAVLGAR